MEKTIKEVTDELGTHRVVTQKNGITVKYLIKPSEKYLKKMQDREQKILEKKEEKRKIKERDKLINDRMRDIAIRELEKEGKI